MWWGLIIAIIVVLIMYSDKDMNKEKKEYKDNYYDELDMNDNDYSLEYLGGFKDFSVKNNRCNLIFFEDKIRIVFKQEYTSTGYKDIYNSDIIDCHYVTEKYIDEQINLGALICFGWLGAIALKDKKQKTNEYVMVKINHNNEIVGIIINSNDLTIKNEDIINKIKNQSKE